MSLEEPVCSGPATFAEQTFIDELVSVIERHRDQSSMKLARLLSKAFDRSFSSNRSREGKMSRALIRGLETRQQLTEAEGGSYSSEEVGRLLHISKTAVLKRLGVGRLLAWREPRQQAARFPRWQFDDHGQVLAGLEETLTVLNQNPHLDVWAKLLFFLQIRQDLDAHRPLDALREGRQVRVIQAAASYAE